VIPLIQQIVGPNVRVIDPAPAVARQVRRVLEAQDICHPAPISVPSFSGKNPIARTRFLTTGDAPGLQAALSHLLGVEAKTEGIEWKDGLLSI